MIRVRRADNHRVQRFLLDHLGYIIIAPRAVLRPIVPGLLPAPAAYRQEFRAGQGRQCLGMQVSHFSASDESCFQFFHEIKLLSMP